MPRFFPSVKADTFLKALHWVGVVLGFILLIFWVYKLGPGPIIETLVSLHFFAVYIFVISFAWHFFYTIAWQLYFLGRVYFPRFKRLLLIRLSGEALTFMLPAGFIAGDPLRMSLLDKAIPKRARLGSIFVDRLLNVLATFIFVFCGLVFSLYFAIQIPQNIQWTVFGVYTGLTGVFLILTYQLVFNPKLTIRLINWLFRRLKFNFLEKLSKNLLHLNQEMANFATGRRRFFFIAFGLHFLGRVLGAIEIAVLFYFLTGDFYWAYSLILASLTSAIGLVFDFVPMGIGVVETAYFFLFKYFNQNPDFDVAPELGAKMQIIRRIRGLFWVMVGLVILKFLGVKKVKTVA